MSQIHGLQSGDMCQDTSLYWESAVDHPTELHLETFDSNSQYLDTITTCTKHPLLQDASQEEGRARRDREHLPWSSSP